MPKPPTDESLNEEVFSWEKWFRMGIRAFKKTLSHYNFGLPEAFWQHLENAFEEFLAAMRIALHTILNRRRGSGQTSPQKSQSIDIEWDDWDDEWD
jgi:hypothetical protein